ncbi:hypothetical protein HDU76_009167 [Blyttiomyces sp. JEL0837]|nr:hypothetical protein HDU76_009167 [Blyttiomyces sp. JEL0837]
MSASSNVDQDIRKPVFVVIGTTGVGKSQFSIELAKAIGGEVINADSMQVYKGLNIITNKVTTEEKQSVPHHLMDFVDPLDEYSVKQFEKDALSAIADIHGRGSIPILVGGTHYYIQSVLWDSHLINSASDNTTDDTTRSAEVESDVLGVGHITIDKELAGQIRKGLEATDSRTAIVGGDGWDENVKELCRLLGLVDPVMAQRWHPNDWRKIRRSLQVYFDTGERHSDLLKKQKDDGGGQLRFKTAFFWLWSEPKALDVRLDARVDKMIDTGLFDEIKFMREKVIGGQVAGVKSADSNGQPEQDSGALTIDYTRGIMQAIGFKEFDAYLSELENRERSPAQSGAVEDSDSGQIKKLEQLQLQGLESMKAGTRRYAKRQVTWIKNKLGPRCLKDFNLGIDVGFFALDATNLDTWNQTVRDTGLDIAKAFLESSKPSPTPLTLELLQITEQDTDTQKDASSAQDWERRTCEICKDRITGEPKVLHGSREWEIHYASSSHRRRLHGYLARKKWEESGKDRGNKKEKAVTGNDEDNDEPSNDTM